MYIKAHGGYRIHILDWYIFNLNQISRYGTVLQIENILFSEFSSDRLVCSTVHRCNDIKTLHFYRCSKIYYETSQ